MEGQGGNGAKNFGTLKRNFGVVIFFGELGGLQQKVYARFGSMIEGLRDEGLFLIGEKFFLVEVAWHEGAI